MAKTQATIITLTLQPGGGSQRQGSLLIQRGELAQLSQFSFGRMSEITAAINAAANALAELEIEPPDLKVASTATTNRRKKARKKATEEQAESDTPEADEQADDSVEEAATPEAKEDPDDLARLL